MYAGLNDGRGSAVPEMARAYDVSYDHLKRVATELCRLGYLDTVRGRCGGFRLAMHPETICIGEVIRQTEREVRLVECFAVAVNTCPLIAPCQLRAALREALAAFFAMLDRYTLADLIRSPEQMEPVAVSRGCSGYTLADLIRSPEQLSPALGLEPAKAAAPTEESSFASR
ncbi:MAG: Rrf2 family transcriptional regulator [Defluviicoccus sp.]|nr:Rrf2 family transcriptional regulator [Defluviicoccus sp.]